MSGIPLLITAGLSGASESSLSLSDVTTGNTSTSKHGLAPKLSGNASQYLDGSGLWSSPSVGSVAESAVTFTDITTNNVSTAKHGYTPKLPNDSTKFLCRERRNWILYQRNGNCAV